MSTKRWLDFILPKKCLTLLYVFSVSLCFNDKYHMMTQNCILMFVVVKGYYNYASFKRINVWCRYLASPSTNSCGSHLYSSCLVCKTIIDEDFWEFTHTFKKKTHFYVGRWHNRKFCTVGKCINSFFWSNLFIWYFTKSHSPVEYEYVKSMCPSPLLLETQ